MGIVPDHYLMLWRTNILSYDLTASAVVKEPESFLKSSDLEIVHDFQHTKGRLEVKRFYPAE